MVKKSISELACFGGEPLFGETLHVGRPNIGDRAKLMGRIDDILDRRWLTNDGPYVREFEDAVADVCGVRNCVAVCNGTLGLELVIRVMGLSGEVIVPSFTFVATVHALLWQGITPVFCDIDPATHCLASDRVSELITDRTSGVVGVHLWGQPCDVDRLGAVCDGAGLKLLFDAAHAFGSSVAGHPVGGFGNAEVFSFHATKYINAFEGGAVVTNDDALAEELRLLRNFGFAGYDNVVSLGINAKMSEISAAMGLTTLESRAEFVAANRDVYCVYREGLERVAGVRLYEFGPGVAPNYQYVVIEIDAERLGMSRDTLMKLLHAEGIFARRYFYPGCHRMQPYCEMFPRVGGRLPVTERLADEVLVLPGGMGTGVEKAARIAGLIGFIGEHAGDIMARLENRGSL